jgi:hypothetical protein
MPSFARFAVQRNCAILKNPKRVGIMVRLILGILLGFWGLPLLVFSAQNLINCLNENESKAALMFFFATGLPSLIMLLGSFLLIRNYTKNPTKPAPLAKSCSPHTGLSSTNGRYCTKCGSELAAEAVFCPQFGQKISVG